MIDREISFTGATVSVMLYNESELRQANVFLDYQLSIKAFCSQIHWVQMLLETWTKLACVQTSSDHVVKVVMRCAGAETSWSMANRPSKKKETDGHRDDQVQQNKPWGGSWESEGEQIV